MPPRRRRRHVDQHQFTGSENRSPRAFEQYRAYDQPDIDAPKYIESEIQSLPHSTYAASEIRPPPRSSYATSRASHIRDIPPEPPVEQSPIVRMPSEFYLSEESGQPTNHFGELDKVVLRLADKIRRLQGKGKAKAASEPPKPAKLEMTDNIKMPKVHHSSASLSAPLRKLENGMSETKKRVQKIDQVESKSLVHVVNRWENIVRAIAQSFEKAEHQRITDLSAAIDREEKRERVKQELAAKVAEQEAEVAETIEQCAERNEDIKRHYKNKFKMAIDHELKKKDGELELKLRQQKKELEADFETKTAAWKSEYEQMPTPASIEQDAKIKYKRELEHFLKEKDEETKQKLEKQKEDIQADFEKKIEALKQEYEKKRSEYVATAIQNLPSSPSSLDTQVEPAASGPKNVSASPLQSTQPLTSASPVSPSEKRDSMSLSDTALPEPKRMILKETEKPFIIHIGSSTPTDIEESTATDKASLKHKLSVVDDDDNDAKSVAISPKRLRTTDAALLKRKRNMVDDDTNDDASATVSPKRHRTMLTPSKLDPPEDASTDIPELDPELEHELFGTIDTPTPQPEDAPIATSDLDPELDRELFGAPPPEKTRTNALLTSSTSSVTKIEGLFSTSYVGLPRWRKTRADMTEEETHELSPIYNPPPPPTIYGGVPRWTTVDEDEEL